MLPRPTQHLLQRANRPFPVSLVQASSVGIKIHPERRKLDELVNPLHAVLDERLDPVLIGRYRLELVEGDTRCEWVLWTSARLQNVRRASLHLAYLFRLHIGHVCP